MNVFITVDVEIWCESWDGIDAQFPQAFRQYVYGPTASGDFGLPFKLRVLNDHGLAGVFFTEPLFAEHFGAEPLEEIVGLICSADQEVQLHLHTEWVDEAVNPILPGVTGKRQFLWDFSLDEQTMLIRKGVESLVSAGAPATTAFRAGSFAFNADTLSALAHNQIRFDSSYNPSQFGERSGVWPPDRIMYQPIEVDGVIEYPMTVFVDRPGHLRHAQLGACSFAELTSMLWQALEQGWDSFVILSHNFELLSPSRLRADRVAVRRFIKLCEFLNQHRAEFTTRGFNDLRPVTQGEQPAPLRSNVARTGMRMIEQVLRRRYA